MALSETTRSYLERHKLPYHLVAHPPTETLEQVTEITRIPQEKLIRVVLLRDQQGVVMAILPSSHLLDFSLVCQVLQRDLEPLYGDELNDFFKGCEPGTRPPLPGLFGLSALVEESLAESDEVFFEGGSRDVLIGMSGRDFRTLMGEARWGHFAPPLGALGAMREQAVTPEYINQVTNRYTPQRLQESVKELWSLPTLTYRLLELQASNKVGAAELIQIVESDPDLAAQVIDWARSPHYGSKSVDTVAEAVKDVLGFDITMNLILGTAIRRTFRIPLYGPMGLNAFWRHSIYCAHLMSELAKDLSFGLHPHSGLVYLSGLLHNFGYLVLGYSFPAQYFLLNRFLAVNAHLPRLQVERYVLGVEHPRIAGWLMRTWQAPPEIIAAVELHHEEDYSQPHAEYPNLCLIANRLLRREGMGDENTGELPGVVMSSLGLSEEQAMNALHRVLARAAELDDLASQIAA